MNTECGYGYTHPPEDEQSDIVSSGLYTFDVEVEFIPYDRDVVRGQVLIRNQGSYYVAIGIDHNGNELLDKLEIQHQIGQCPYS